MAGGWATSKKFRFQQKALAKHLTKQEAYWRERVLATVREYTPEEIEAYARERGLPVAPSILEKMA